MALDFQAMQTELYAHGFDYLNDGGGAGTTRAKRFINEAMHEIDGMQPWDYLKTTFSGALPTTLADLDRVESIFSPTLRIYLEEWDRPSIVEAYGNLTDAGQAFYWYKTSPTTIACFPVDATTWTVNYTKFGPDLVANGDTPLMPDRFRQAIVEGAAAKAHRAVTNENEARACESARDAIVGRMLDSQVSLPRTVRLVGWP